jgi:uncharacterized protein (DUF2267 family)
MEANYSHVNPENLDQEEMYFLLQIKKELSLENSHEAVKLVASVLQALRQTLTLENAQSLLNKLPDFLKLAFAANWEQNEAQVPVQHLDEFVSLVMDRDKKSRKNLFKNEVQTLTVIILTLKKLHRLIDLQNFEGLSTALRQELKDVPSEAAA